MRRTVLSLAFAFGLAAAALPSTAVAQGDAESESEGAESESSESAASESTETSEESAETQGSGGEESASSGEEGAGETEEKEAASGQKEGDSGKNDKQAKKEKQANKEKKEGASAEGEGSGEESDMPDEGPGGQKLRKDYPGTDESKTGQMESDRIEGLKFDEGQKPGKAYDVEIQELETKVDDLKEKVFQSKSRVVLLKETVLGGNLSGSRAMIVHSNEIGGNFRLKRAMFSLDGNRIFNESGKNKKLKRNKFKVYDGSISSGNHNVSILLEYQGSGFGVFNYMQAYNMKITSSCQFEAEPGKATVLRVAAVKKGGAVEEAMKNADVRCEIETTDVSQQAVQEGEGDGGPSEGKLSTDDEESEE